MKHFFYFTGYSDDIVLAGSSEKNLDEHYQMFYMLNNGVQIKAVHGPIEEPNHPGWKITSDHPSAIRIPAIAEDVEHTDPRIPDWLDARSYADVLIIEADEPLEIVLVGDKTLKPLTTLGLFAARVAKDYNECQDLDPDEGLCVSDLEEAIRKHLPACVANCQKCWTAPDFGKEAAQ